MLDAVKQSLAPHGKLRAAINMSNFLLVSGRTADGEPDGISPDLAREIARRLDVPCVLVPYEGPGPLGDDVNNDVWDIGNIAIEPERAQTIDFSSSYVNIDANFMVRTDSPLTGNDQVNKPGVEIILYNRSAYDLWLTDNFKNPAFNRVASIQESHDRFHAGESDALASLKPKLVDELALSDSYRLIEPPFTAIRQAVGIKKGQTKALRFLNELIAELISTGFVAASLKKHGTDQKLSIPV